MTDSIYNERVCPICKEWIWKWDKECLKCHPKKKKVRGGISGKNK